MENTVIIKLEDFMQMQEDLKKVRNECNGALRKVDEYKNQNKKLKHEILDFYCKDYKVEEHPLEKLLNKEKWEFPFYSAYDQLIALGFIDEELYEFIKVKKAELEAGKEEENE